MVHVKRINEMNNSVVEKNINKKYKEIISAQKSVLSELDNVRTLCIMSPQNPLGNKDTNRNNRTNKKKFEKYLKDGFYAFHKVLGKYGQYEDSYFVYNISLNDAKQLNLEYMQDSFIFMENNKVNLVFSASKYRDVNGEKFYEHTGTVSGHITNRKDATDLFTKIGKKFKFSIPFDSSVFEDIVTFVDNYNSILENNRNDYSTLLDEILDDTKTGHAKYTRRVLLYGKTQQNENQEN